MAAESDRRRGLHREARARLARLLAPSERTVVAAMRWLTGIAIAIANLIGMVIVFVLLAWVIPPPRTDVAHIVTLNLIFAFAYLGLALLVGLWLVMRRLRPGRRWLEQRRAPTAAEQRNILRAPMVIFVVVTALWLLAALLFGIVNTTFSAALGRRVVITILLAGLGTGAVAYLIGERLLRAVAARALAARELDDPALPGVTARTVFTWALGSGVPMLGLAILGASALLGEDYSRNRLAVAMIALAAVGLLVGLFATLIAARVTADPIVSVRRGVASVAAGDFDARVPVYDGSELGLLQSGFNEMAAGLQERERIRDLFGRHVGEDVARVALGREGRLGGEVRIAAVLFVDMTGSTELASARPAREVVEILNEFFGVIVEAVDEQGGWINKFEGDAALAVFGAPIEIRDPAGRALAAARASCVRLAERLPDIEAGIGVAYGELVAGNIGGAKRFEYTVIGDAVNEAARLMEIAKQRRPTVLASGAAVEAAGVSERERWVLEEEVVLRGRSRPTRLARPVVDGAGREPAEEGAPGAAGEAEARGDADAGRQARPDAERA